MRQRRFLLLGLVSAVLVLTACGGGGGSSSPGSSGTGGGSGGNGTQSIDTQRAVSGSALSVAGASVDYNQIGGPQSATLLGIQDAAALAAAAPAGGPLIPVPGPTGNGSCNNGVEFTFSSTSGTITERIEFFYDAACTKPYRLQTVTITPPPKGAAGTGTSSGTTQVWDQNGNSVSYQTFTQTFTVNANGMVTQISQMATKSVSPSSPPTSQFGSTCLVGPTATTAIDCGTGNTLTDTSANEALGFAETTLGSFVVVDPLPSPAPSATPKPTAGAPIYRGAPSALVLTIAGTGYTGAIGSLSLSAATAPAWKIAGGTQVVTLTGTATIGFGYSSVMSNADLTLVDSADGLTATLTSSHGPGLTGTVTNASGATVATIAVDFSGTGKVSFSNGTTEAVKDWVIIG